MARFIPLIRKRELEEAVIEHIDSLYNTALRMTGNKADAEDLVQDTYLRANRFSHRFKRGTNAKAWLLTILRNLYLNDYRKRTRQPPMVPFEEVEPFYCRSGGGEPFPLSSLTDLETKGEMFDDAVKTALDKMPDDLKMVVVLFYIEELSYKEIARIAGCPIGTVMSRLYTARKLLRNSLSEYARKGGYKND